MAAVTGGAVMLLVAVGLLAASVGGWLRQPRDTAGAAVAATPQLTTTTTRGIVDGRHHVDIAAGDDRLGNGTAERPWQTLAHTIGVARKARGAVTIVIHGSPDTPYREPLGPNAGLISRPMRIIAAAGAQPVISGAVVFSVRNTPANGAAGPSWVTPDQAGGVWEAAYSSPFPAPPLDVNRDPTDTASGCSDNRRYCIYPDQVPDGSGAGGLERVWIDGRPLRPVSARDLVDESTFFFDRDLGRLVVGTDPTDATVETAARQRAAHLARGAAGSTVEGITFTRFAPFHAGGRAAIVVTADRVLLRDLTVTQNSATALYLGGEPGQDLTGVRLVRVAASRNGATGLTANRVTDLVIEDSSFDGNNAAGFDASSGPSSVLAGAKLVRCTDVRVQGSSFSDNNATGLWFDLGCVNVSALDNAVQRNARHGIYFEVSRLARIERNTISGHGPAGVGLNLSGSDDVNVAGNRFLDNDRHLWVPDDPNTGRSDADRRYLAERGVDTDPSGIVIGTNEADGPLG